MGSGGMLCHTEKVLNTLNYSDLCFLPLCGGNVYNFLKYDRLFNLDKTITL